MKLYVFQTVPPSVIGSLFTVHSAIVYVIQVCRQLSSKTRMVLIESCLKCPKHVEFHDTIQFVKFVHLVGFITKKFVTMHGQTNAKKNIHILLNYDNLLVFFKLRQNIVLIG